MKKPSEDDLEEDDFAQLTLGATNLARTCGQNGEVWQRTDAPCSISFRHPSSSTTQGAMEILRN
jgi:hypothetical protein